MGYFEMLKNKFIKKNFWRHCGTHLSWTASFNIKLKSWKSAANCRLMCFWSMLYKKYNVCKAFSYYSLCSWDWRTLTLPISNIKVRHVLVKGQGQMSISTEVTLKTWPPCLRLKLLYNVRTTRKLRRVKTEIICTFH